MSEYGGRSRPEKITPVSAVKRPTEQFAIKPSMSDPVSILECLQAGMIDLYGLSILGKLIHWSMQGGAAAISFLPVHREIDEIVDFARDGYDTLSERIIQLGGFPDARSATIVAGTPLDEPSSWTDPR